MTPSEIREELLSQHASIRGRLEAARLSVVRWVGGEVPQMHVREELAGLAEALRSHNLREERVLREAVRTADAWGPTRVEIMEEEHIREHRELYEAVVAISQAQDPLDGQRTLERYRRRLLEHIDREEETFLNASVLRDDLVAFGGFDA
jgi:hypothetical protein